MGSLVRVTFHGRRVHGWVLGSTDDVPPRIHAVADRISSVRVFDEPMLDLARWVSDRYVVPLAAVLARLRPPRVASEESEPAPPAPDPPPGGGPITAPATPDVLDPGYRGGDALLASIAGAGRHAFVVRPAPEDEVAIAVEAIERCLAAGRRAIVLVPEASPVPASAVAVLDAFGDRAVGFLGGDRRTRYRTWLSLAGGRGDVVVGTRPAVFAPIRDLGLIFVVRESHPAHREDRSPYSHVREIALRRGRNEGATVVLSALCPSSEATALELPTVVAASRRWPMVEVVKPGPEGRAPRLVQALREASRGFVYSPLPGYGVAQVCRSCGRSASCAACGGLLRLEEGRVACVVCEASGRCGACGGTSFGVRRGGAERLEEWVRQVSGATVRRARRPRLPRAGEILVGGPEVVRDLGPAGLDLVAIVDADLAERRPGLAARERAVAMWMEVAAWAQPGGRVIMQASDGRDPAVQAVVRGNPERFHEQDRRRRAESGFPVGAPVFRVAGGPGLDEHLARFDPITMLASSDGERTVCLLALPPDRLPAFGRAMRELAAGGAVARVEAEPHL